MKYEVEEVCAFCNQTIRRYTVTKKPPGQVLITAHPLCREEYLAAETEHAFAMDSIHGRNWEMN